MIELFLRKTGEFYVIALDQERCLIPQKNITMAVKNAARHIFKKLPQCEIVCFRHVLKIKELNPRIRLGSQVAQIFIRIQDKTKHSPQINWETKDKYIIDLLYTKKAKKIAKERMQFSIEFLNRLEKEIKGEL